MELSSGDDPNSEPSTSLTRACLGPSQSISSAGSCDPIPLVQSMQDQEGSGILISVQLGTVSQLHRVNSIRRQWVIAYCIYSIVTTVGEVKETSKCNIAGI